MKEDRGAEKPWPKPAYNVQIGAEGQFITGFRSIPEWNGFRPILCESQFALPKNALAEQIVLCSTIHLALQTL